MSVAGNLGKRYLVANMRPPAAPRTGTVSLWSLAGWSSGQRISQKGSSFGLMIAYILLRLAAKAAKIQLDILRFTELVGVFLFARRRLTAIDIPPPTNPSRKRDKSNPNQSTFCFA